MFLQICAVFFLLLLGLVRGSDFQRNSQDQGEKILSTSVHENLLDLPNPQVLGTVADPELIEALLQKLHPATHSLYISKIIRHQLKLRPKTITKNITPCHRIIELCLDKLGRQKVVQEDTFWKCIQILVYEGDSEMVKIFHRAGYIVDDTEFLRLRGIASNRKEMIEFFLENGKCLIDFELTVILMLQNHEIDPAMIEHFVSKGLPFSFKKRSFNLLEVALIKGNIAMAYYFYKSGFSLNMLDNNQMDICKSKLRPEDLVKFMAFKEKMFWIYEALEDKGSAFSDFPNDIVTTNISALLLACGSMENTEPSWLSALKCHDIRSDLFSKLVESTRLTYSGINWLELVLHSGRFDLGKPAHNQ